jgi:hypothetical protein
MNWDNDQSLPSYTRKATHRGVDFESQWRQMSSSSILEASGDDEYYTSCHRSLIWAWLRFIFGILALSLALLLALGVRS